MQCFITGATGFIGSAIGEKLLERGYEVTGLTSSPGKIGSLEKKGIRPVLGDMNNPEEWSPAVRNADVIIHTATIPPPVRPGKRYMAKLLSAQRTTVSHLLKEVQSCEVFVYTSGMTVYGAGPALKSESSAINPVELARPYVLGEQLVMEAYRERDVPGMILRPAGVYGDGGVFGRYWTEPMKNGKRAPYPGNGEQVKSFISVEDCAQAYVTAVENPMPGQVINIADDEPVAFNTLIPFLAERIEAPNPPGIPAPLFRILAGRILAEMLLTDMRISNRKMKEELGVTLNYPTYREGISALAGELGEMNTIESKP